MQLRKQTTLALQDPAQPLSKFGSFHLLPAGLRYYTGYISTWESSGQGGGRDVVVRRDIAGSMMINHTAVGMCRRGGRANELWVGRGRREHVLRGGGRGRLLVARATRLGYLALEVVRLAAQNIGNVVPRSTVLVRGGRLLLLLLWVRRDGWRSEAVRGRAAHFGTGARGIGRSRVGG